MTLRISPCEASLSTGIDVATADINVRQPSRSACLEYLRSRLTICITTKDRQDDIDEQFRTLSSLGLHTLPIRIVDDGSAVPIRIDMSTAFADLVLVRHDVSAGYIERRNDLIANAGTPFVLSLDDDSSPVALRDLSDVLSEMEAHSNWAVVGYTIVDSQRRDLAAVPQPSAPPHVVLAREFVGCGFIVRRDVFRHLGGFTTALWYLGEERDFSMRALASGYEILRVKNRHIIHYKSAVNRCSSRLVENTARNNPVIWLLNSPSFIRWLLYLRSVSGILSLIVRKRWNPGCVFRGLLRGRALYHAATRPESQRLSYRLLWAWWLR
jgi:GT2 family glycosyltransferase